MIYDFLGQPEVAPLPSCYSSDFDACIVEFEKNTPVAGLSPYCQQFYARYKATAAPAWDAAMESLPFCPAPAAPAEKKKSAATLWLLGAGAAGLLLGTLIR